MGKMTGNDEKQIIIYKILYTVLSIISIVILATQDTHTFHGEYETLTDVFIGWWPMAIALAVSVYLYWMGYRVFGFVTYLVHFVMMGLCFGAAFTYERILVGMWLNVMMLLITFVIQLSIFKPNVPTKRKIVRIVIVGCLMFVFLGIAFMNENRTFNDTGNYSESTKICASCGREYSDSTNKKSISKTNMCTNCYNNYKSMEQFIGK